MLPVFCPYEVMNYRQTPSVESHFVQSLRKTVANSSRDVAAFVTTYGTHYLTDIQMEGGIGIGISKTVLLYHMKQSKMKG